MNLKVRNHYNPDALIIDLDGDFDLYASHAVKLEIVKLVEQGNHIILLNMEKVKYIDSTGIGALIKIMLLLKPLNGTVKLYNVNETPRRVLKLTMVDKMLEVCETEETAINSIKR